MTTPDPRQDLLRRMADGPDKLMAEMAREVRSGRMTLREAAASSAYRGIFETGAQHLAEAMRGVTREDLAKAVRAQTAAEPPSPAPPSDDDFDQPILRRR